MHNRTTGRARRVLTRYEVIPVKGGNIRENIPGVSRFRTDEPEVKCCRFNRLGRCGGRRTAYSDSSRRSEQLSYRKHFHPSYGLFSMNFQRSKHFQDLFKLTEKIK